MHIYASYTLTMVVPQFTEKLPVAIIGANGYTGLELARLLLKHPGASLRGCFARDGQWSLSEDLPEMQAAEVPSLKIEELRERIGDFKSVFLATPSEVSMELVPLLYQSGVQVIDLSGAFRLDQLSFEKAYELKHSAPKYLSRAHYGLMPWAIAQTARQNGAALISNPGCYATSILMALIPLLQHRILDPERIVIDSKSGTSGAGRKAKDPLIFTEVADDCLPYRVGRHQHLPELIRYLSEYTGIEVKPHFSTSLLPVRRGITSAIYATANTNLKDGPEILDRIDSAFYGAYEKYPLVKFGRITSRAEKDRNLLSLKRVVGSCRTHITYTVTDDQIYLFSSIDNLLKGAASQAIENWNSLNGFPLEQGLYLHEGLL